MCNANNLAATSFDLCSRESRARLWAAMTQSDTACKLGVVREIGAIEAVRTRGEPGGQCALTMRRRIGLSGATLGIRMLRGVRGARWAVDLVIAVEGYPIPMEKLWDRGRPYGLDDA